MAQSAFMKRMVNLMKAEKKKKDPFASGESFTTLHNKAARDEEHQQLLREQGFPSEQDPNAMRYQRYVEVESDPDSPDGVAHNQPPWIVNEASELLADIPDEDAPSYSKSEKAKNRAGELSKSEGIKYGNPITPERYQPIEKKWGEGGGKSYGELAQSKNIEDRKLAFDILSRRAHKFQSPNSFKAKVHKRLHGEFGEGEYEYPGKKTLKGTPSLFTAPKPKSEPDLEKGLGDVARKIGRGAKKADRALGRKINRASDKAIDTALWGGDRAARGAARGVGKLTGSERLQEFGEKPDYYPEVRREQGLHPNWEYEETPSEEGDLPPFLRPQEEEESPRLTEGDFESLEAAKAAQARNKKLMADKKLAQAQQKATKAETKVDKLPPFLEQSLTKRLIKLQKQEYDPSIAEQRTPSYPHNIPYDPDAKPFPVLVGEGPLQQRSNIKAGKVARGMRPIKTQISRADLVSSAKERFPERYKPGGSQYGSDIYGQIAPNHPLYEGVQETKRKQDPSYRPSNAPYIRTPELEPSQTKRDFPNRQAAANNTLTKRLVKLQKQSPIEDIEAKEGGPQRWQYKQDPRFRANPSGTAWESPSFEPGTEDAYNMSQGRPRNPQYGEYASVPGSPGGETRIPLDASDAAIQALWTASAQAERQRAGKGEYEETGPIDYKTQMGKEHPWGPVGGRHYGGTVTLDANTGRYYSETDQAISGGPTRSTPRIHTRFQTPTTPTQASTSPLAINLPTGRTAYDKNKLDTAPKAKVPSSSPDEPFSSI